MHLVVRHTKQIPHKLVSLADQLHIAIFDAVVYHFHKMACAVLADPVAAGAAVLHLRADGLEDGLYEGPGSRRTAGHHAGAPERALFAAGYAGSHIEFSLSFHRSGSADGVGKMGVAAVYDDIAVLQKR